MTCLKTALGLMSGTSMDGIDAAAVRTDGEGHLQRGPSLFVPYEEEFRRRLETALVSARVITRRTERPADLAEIERDLTLRHASAVQRFRDAFPEWAGLDVVGFHGQTVLHRPDTALTVQLGDGPRLAREIGIAVVYDMRAADMAEGGQGAPLVPAYHQALARSFSTEIRDRSPVIFVNIGGISNVTFVPTNGDPIAFDSGPGNQLIDQWMQREGGVAYDADGATAAKGYVQASVVEAYLNNPFFGRSVPKSLDRGDFMMEGVADLNLADGARTLAAVAAKAVFAAAQHVPEHPALWILCGGGRKNPHIVADLRSLVGLVGGEVMLAEDVGFDGDATEAEAWAYLAVRSMKGLPITWPTTTGCRLPTSGGLFTGAG